MEKKHEPPTEGVTPLDRQLAVPMFVISVLFLLIAGALLHLTQGHLGSPLALTLLSVMAVLYLAFVAEALLQWRAGGRQMRQHIRYLLLPILRLCPRDHVAGDHAWLPVIGWRKTSAELEHYLTRVFSLPMIAIALMVLPVVGVEFLYTDWIAEQPRRKFLIDTCSGFIWMAFVFEFVVMVSIVEKRLRYCKRNWIDVAVVFLPLVSFMGAAPLGRLVKLKQLSRTAKIYRMRGLLLRTWRALVALDALDKLLRRDAEHRFEKLQAQIDEKQQELELLKLALEREREKINGNAEPAS